MDEETAVAVLNCQLEDILASIELRKGKQKQGESTDLEHALTLQAAELKATINSFNDRRMCQSMSRAIQDDFPILATEFALERQAERDREQALDLVATESGSRRTSRRGSIASVISQIELPSEDIVARLASLNFFRDDDTCTLIGDDDDSEDDNAGEGSSGLARRQCVACTSTFPASKTYTAPCGDVYCNGCTIQLHEDGLKDESLFPPRCCRQDMPLSSVSITLGADLAHRVEMKMLEYSTLNKIYCAVKTCSTFIKPYEILDNRGTCSACDEETCTLCKALGHAGKCEEAKDDVLLALARAEGWRQCHHCHTMVELGVGCYHMTCRCRAEFCYLCGVPWKKCTCRQWDEERLQARAEEIVARQPLPVGLNQAQAIQRAARVLNERHECEHSGRFRRINGRRQCEMCRHWLRDFLLQCKACENLMVCNDCRRNRL